MQSSGHTFLVLGRSHFTHFSVYIIEMYSICIWFDISLLGFFFKSFFQVCWNLMQLNGFLYSKLGSMSECFTSNLPALLLTAVLYSIVLDPVRECLAMTFFQFFSHMSGRFTEKFFQKINCTNAYIIKNVLVMKEFFPPFFLQLVSEKASTDFGACTFPTSS